MILENMAVTGFRGISQLSLPLEGTNVLIGENAWGKSSLLDALTLLLAPQPDLYAFRPHDFHFAQGDAARRERDLQVVFTFCEREAGEADALHYQVFAPLWWCGEDGLRRLTLKMTGHQPDAGEVITHRQFVDACSQPLLTDERALAAIKTLIRLHPVLRLRDARFIRRLRPSTLNNENPADNKALSLQLDQFQALCFVLGSVFLGNCQQYVLH